MQQAPIARTEYDWSPVEVHVDTTAIGQDEVLVILKDLKSEYKLPMPQNQLQNLEVL